MQQRTTSYILATLIIFGAAAIGLAKEPDRSVELFSQSAGADSGVAWKAFCEDPETDAGAIHEFRDNVLILKGGPLGYLRTEQQFTNFVLELEWRRPPGKKPGRGGVLIRMTGEDKVWPKCLEAQLNAGDAGDFWGLVGYRLDGPAQRLKRIQHDQFGTLTNVKKAVDAEKPVGEWNWYEITARDDVVTLKINGKTVNQATGCDVVAGKICLTAEGDEIHFRNVRLTSIAR